MADTDTLEGKIFSNRYLLGARLGEGGMGTVYRGTDLRTGGAVAIKVVHPSLASDSDYVLRLRREAQLAASVDSPRVVRVVDLNVEDGVTYLVMEYVDGKTLAERLRAGTLTVRQSLYIARELAWALDSIHARGVIHRDLKPQNIMVDSGGAVKLLDFGIARSENMPGVTSVGMFVGSPLYTAPERIDGNVDMRSDIYAIGAILFEMLTGSPPFTGPTPMTVLRKHEKEPPPPLPETAPPKTHAVVARCLAKEPAGRFQTARELVQALAEALAEAGGTSEVRRQGESVAGATALSPTPPPPDLSAVAPTAPAAPSQRRGGVTPLPSGESSGFVDRTMVDPGYAAASAAALSPRAASAPQQAPGAASAAGSWPPSVAPPSSHAATSLRANRPAIVVAAVAAVAALIVLVVVIAMVIA